MNQKTILLFFDEDTTAEPELSDMAFYCLTLSHSILNCLLHKHTLEKWRIWGFKNSVLTHLFSL